MLHVLSEDFFMFIYDWWESASQPKYEKVQADCNTISKLKLGVFFSTTHVICLSDMLTSASFLKFALNNIFCVNEYCDFYKVLRQFLMVD